MKEYIISLVLVMVMSISVSAYAGETAEDEEIKAARNIIAMAEEHAKIFSTRNHAIVEFWFCIYDLPEYKRYITIIVKALYAVAEAEGKNLNRIFFLNLDKSLVGHADKEVIIFSDDITI